MVQEKPEVPAILRRPPSISTPEKPSEQPAHLQNHIHAGTISDIEYEIKGQGSQFVEIKLRPSQAITGEISALMYYESGITMKMRAGISVQEGKEASFLQKLLGLGKAVVSGRKLFMMHFTNTTAKELKVAFSMPYSGDIVPIDLNSIGGRIFCQNDSFLCATSTLQISPATPKELGGNFLNSTISMQKIEGKGGVFLFCGGSLLEKNIAQGLPVHVTTGTTLAIQPGIALKVKTIRNVGLTGEGHMLTELSGAGHAWFQSLPFKRQNDNIIASVGMFFGIQKKKKNPIWSKK